MRICIIGSSGHYSYALPQLFNNPQLDLVALAPGTSSEDMGQVAALLQKRGLKPVSYSNHLALLEQEKPDIAIINTHFQHNATVIKQALERQIHVFAEKPLALELTELAEIEKLWQESGCQLTTMLGLRSAAHFYTGQQLCRQGAIGQLRLMQAQKSYRLGQRPAFYKSRKTYGGTIPWVGIHAIDWFYWFSQVRFLTVAAGHSRLANQGLGQLEMTAQAFFRLEDEILASFSLDYLRPAQAASHADDRLRVVGTAGVLDIKDGNVYLLNSRSAGDQPEKLLDPPDFFADFCAQVKGEGRASISGQDAIYLSRISLLTRQAADENQPVSLI